MSEDSQVPGPNIMTWASKPEAWSEVISNPKDSGRQQTRKKVWERKSDGEDVTCGDFALCAHFTLYLVHTVLTSTFFHF
ncbi:hypothetical protein PAXRUDRAFT_22769 [Paxillus rubicundulus Ve08.2h10]|uniref:Uncharacterized protein n=1 Tax=Paxillus rubicundulus Ve08.2h10 TaxID=930991 RepID=A0A0D0CMM6_9AGAM|nr:hypothetical protein PAXRUDRAFT_22769 [Paxillus rubicundulus Ve08.2h10]